MLLRRQLLLLTLSGIMAAAAPVGSALPDLTGTWMGMIHGRQRQLDSDISFRLEQHGAELTGILYTDRVGGDEILEGRVEPDGRVHWIVEVREQNGNQFHDVRYRYTGEICGEGIELTREKYAVRDAISGVEIPVRRPNDDDEQDRQRRFQSFRLERLF